MTLALPVDGGHLTWIQDSVEAGRTRLWLCVSCLHQLTPPSTVPLDLVSVCRCWLTGPAREPCAWQVDRRRRVGRTC